MKKAALFWSGGKDCAYALHKVLTDNDYHVETLVTTLNSEYRRISMHGIREELLERQAQALNIPLLKMWVGNVPKNENYEDELIKTYKELKL
ncbi:MAG TPA: ATP-binding protein, partial [Sphingobacteriaceae bacterium]